MNKCSLNQRLDKAFSNTNNDLIGLKGPMIGLCADIERYFKAAFNVYLNEDVGEEEFARIKRLFPHFNKLTLEQFNRLVLMFITIRTVSAHLYLNKTIYVDSDLKDFISDCLGRSYLIEDEKRLTIYGAVVVLALFAQKYMIWPFCTSFFKHQLFLEIKPKKEMSLFQIEQQKKFNEICGKGKALTQFGEKASGIERQYMNDVLKKCLTNVFFELESSLTATKICSSTNLSFSSALKRSDVFSDELTSKISSLRNCWFHGISIGDLFEQDHEIIEFSLEFAIGTLRELKSVAKNNSDKFYKIFEIIDDFGKSFFNYYVLRMVEVSYKLLDSRLSLEEKFEERIKHVNDSFQRFNAVDPNTFELLASLMECKEIKWAVSPSKFLDNRFRWSSFSNLKILKLHSESGFTIGELKTINKDIVLANVVVDEKYKNLVNGRDINNLKGTLLGEYSRFITVESVNL